MIKKLKISRISRLKLWIKVGEVKLNRDKLGKTVLV